MNTILEPGNFTIMIGSASDNILLSDRLMVTGETVDIEAGKLFFSEAAVS
jgi:hypothetical protein